jgi:glutathione synthase/RimK-type ligase-like ATP-grasp enzyme
MSGERAVLIVTEPLDVHADFVIHELKKRDVPVFRFHTEDFPVSSQISISGAGAVWSAEIRTPQRTLRLADVRAAWLRRPGAPVVDAAMHPESKEFAIQQARSTIAALYAMVGDRWLSHPESMRAAADRVRQMRLAAAAGLAVPDTLIGNDADRAVEFHNDNVRLGRGTAVKSLWVRTQISYDGGLRLPMTTTWPENAESDQVEMIRLTPAVFQEYVPKQREIRAVVIGGRVFAASVDSQAIPAARHDVRAVARQARYEPYDLPEAVRDALLEIVRGFGLRFCSADLVLTPDGRHVFLDLNANGQWLWLELEAGLPLSAAMADLLAAGFPEPSARAG